jgi:hypothetical protein
VLVQPISATDWRGCANRHHCGRGRPPEAALVAVVLSDVEPAGGAAPDQNGSTGRVMSRYRIVKNTIKKNETTAAEIGMSLRMSTARFVIDS